MQEVEHKLKEEQEMRRREKDAQQEQEHEQEEVQGAKTKKTMPIQVEDSYPPAADDEECEQP